MSDALDALPLHPPTLHSSVVHVDGEGRAVPDPRAILGVDPDEHDAVVIRHAWRDTLLAHPPESDPHGAREAREARDRLLDPQRVLERELGTLHVPDPDAWGLPDLRPERTRPGVTPEARLLGQAVLYTLLEEALWTDGLGEAVNAAVASLHES